MTTIFMTHKEKSHLLLEKMLFSLLRKVILNLNDAWKRSYSVRNHGEIYIHARKKKIKFYEKEKFRFILHQYPYNKSLSSFRNFSFTNLYLYRIVITCLQTTLQQVQIDQQMSNLKVSLQDFGICGYQFKTACR